MTRPRRILIGCILALVALLGAIGVVEFLHLRHRHAALARLRQVGVVMHGMSTDEFYDTLRSKGAPSRRSTWERFWDDYRPKNIASISLRRRVFTDELIELINVFAETQRLELTDCEISDEQFGELVALQKLQFLRLNRAPITDAGIVQLTNFQKLRTLELKGVPITDACVEHLAKLPNLDVLRIQGTLISDTGAAKLTSAKNLQRLEVTAMDNEPRLITRALKDTFAREHPTCRVSLYGIDDPLPWSGMQDAP